MSFRIVDSTPLPPTSSWDSKPTSASTICRRRSLNMWERAGFASFLTIPRRCMDWKERAFWSRSGCRSRLLRTLPLETTSRPRKIGSATSCPMSSEEPDESEESNESDEFLGLLGHDKVHKMVKFALSFVSDEASSQAASNRMGSFLG